MVVIWEGGPWRDYLCADAVALRKRAASKRATEKRSILVERMIFLAAYSMRRLDDATKLSTSWKGRAVQCCLAEPTGTLVDFMNWHHLDRHYNLASTKRRTMGARDLCDMIIHSFVFAESLGDLRSIEGIFVTSDNRKTEGLWLFSIDSICQLMVQTAQDSPSTRLMSRDPATGSLNVWAGDGEPPASWKKMVQARERKALA